MSDNQSEDGRDYDVGYGKPPKSTRWKKRQSGNPSGRAKGSRGIKTDLHAELVSRMDIKMNGQRVSGTKQQLMLKTLSTRAAAGDVRSIKMLIDLVLQVFGAEDRGGSKKQLSAQDQQILDQLLSRPAKSRPADPNDENIEPPLTPANHNLETDDD